MKITNDTPQSELVAIIENGIDCSSIDRYIQQKVYHAATTELLRRNNHKALKIAVAKQLIKSKGKCWEVEIECSYCPAWVAYIGADDKEARRCSDLVDSNPSNECASLVSIATAYLLENGESV